MHDNGKYNQDTRCDKLEQNTLPTGKTAQPWLYKGIRPCTMAVFIGNTTKNALRGEIYKLHNQPGIANETQHCQPMASQQSHSRSLEEGKEEIQSPHSYSSFKWPPCVRWSRHDVKHVESNWPKTKYCPQNYISRTILFSSPNQMWPPSGCTGPQRNIAEDQALYYMQGRVWQYPSHRTTRNKYQTE